MNPLVVEKMVNGKYKIIDGNARYVSMKMMGMKFVNCIILGQSETIEIPIEKLTNMKSLTDGMCAKDVNLPKEFPKGLIKDDNIPTMDSGIMLAPGAKISAHACDVCASINVSNVIHYNVQIKGTFEQLRFLCETWLRQLNEMENEA